MVSIYQAGESLFELFDKVCVIYEGKMAYYGRASEARQYFIDMGCVLFWFGEAKSDMMSGMSQPIVKLRPISLSR